MRNIRVSDWEDIIYNIVLYYQSIQCTSRSTMYM